jgi:hypothetical protein
MNFQALQVTGVANGLRQHAALYPGSNEIPSQAILPEGVQRPAARSFLADFPL